MDMTYPPEAEQFRKEIRAWLEEHLPDGWFEPGFELKGEERARFRRRPAPPAESSKRSVRAIRP